MRKFIVCLSFVFFSIYIFSESDEKLRLYFEYFQAYPEILGPRGNWKKGEIEIILDSVKIQEIQVSEKLRFLKMGMTEQKASENAQVGIVYEDQYIFWIRDAVRFPTGDYGIYKRLLFKSSVLKHPQGNIANNATVLPILPDNRVVLIVTFRHPTRTWEVELPRGGVRKNETRQGAAIRETREETGYIVEEVFPLGTIAAESGFLTNQNAIYCARVKEIASTQLDLEEVIPTHLILTKDEVLDSFALGKKTINIGGNEIVANFRDPFLSYAILLAEKKGYLN